MEAAAYAHFMRDLAEAQEGGSAVGAWAEAEAEAAEAAAEAAAEVAAAAAGY